MNQAYISVGSNVPDKEIKIEEGLRALRQLNVISGFEVSQIYSTPSCNGVGPDYSNCVVGLYTTLTADELNNKLKDIEKQAGRTHDASSDRHIVELDLDLVVFDNEILRQCDFDRRHFRIGYEQLNSSVRNIPINNFFYELPDERIARHPLADRDLCKLLVADKYGVRADAIFADLLDYISPYSTLVYNNTRVINARLRFHKASGALIEIFCLEPVSPSDYQVNFASSGPVEWRCFVGNSKRWKNGSLEMTIECDNKTKVILIAERTQRCDGDSIVRFIWNNESLSFAQIIEMAGEIPIPPYLNRSTEKSDSTDYQTIFSRIEGSVAAPTAGLHFTSELLNRIDRAGIERGEVTLHVGAGTFQPVKSEHIGDHPMHAEFIVVTRDLIQNLANTDRTIIAVGTTTVRTLESLYHIGCLIATDRWNGVLEQWYPYGINHPALSVRDSLNAILAMLEQNGDDRLIASTRIIIAPGYKYRIVKQLITNFHQPGSTLLLLVSAMIGDSWRQVYEHALAGNYRFLSYGDACLLSV